MEDVLEIFAEIGKCIFEVIFEIIVDGIFELLALKNVAMPVRIIIWLLLALIFVAVII